MMNLNSELPTCRKIRCNTNVCGSSDNTKFWANRSEFTFLVFHDLQRNIQRRRYYLLLGYNSVSLNRVWRLC